MTAPAIALKIGQRALELDGPADRLFTSAILAVTGSPYCHAEFWHSGPQSAARCFSARQFSHGVGWATLDLTDSALWLALPLDAYTGSQCRDAEFFCNGSMGRNYDSEGILGILRDNGWHDDADRFCSEMVMDIGQNCLGWRTDLLRYHVAPGWTHGGDRYGLYELVTGAQLVLPSTLK